MEITYLGHASFRVVLDGIVIYLDPYYGEDYEVKADIILVTHGHYDHSSPEKIRQVRTDETLVLTTAQNAHAIEGEAISAGEKVEHRGLTISAIPAYNTAKSFHARGSCLGFLVKGRVQSIYHAGDTDRIAEMKGLSPDVALLPVGGTYTMDADQAAQAAADICPRIAIPMHYGPGIVGSPEDALHFQEMVEESEETEVTVLAIGETLAV